MVLRTDRVNERPSLLWQDGDHGEGRAGLDGPSGVEESPRLRPLHGRDDLLQARSDGASPAVLAGVAQRHRRRDGVFPQGTVMLQPAYSSGEFRGPENRPRGYFV